MDGGWMTAQTEVDEQNMLLHCGSEKVKYMV